MFDRSSRQDFERIRLRMAELVWPELDLSGGGVPAFVGRVTSLASKIEVGSFLMVQPMAVLGPEMEGGSGDFTSVGSKRVPVYLLGPGVPATGDDLVCKFVDNRWVAERSNGSGVGTGGSGTIPGCFCAEIPVTLKLTSASETCNFGMFQSCTIMYQPVPSVYAALDLGTHAFISVESFADMMSGGAIFQYLLLCQFNQFSLTRIYAESPFGSPWQDAILYTWFVGSYGNTCSPFHLDNGAAYPGSDVSCFVTIDAA